MAIYTFKLGLSAVSVPLISKIHYVVVFPSGHIQHQTVCGIDLDNSPIGKVEMQFVHNVNCPECKRLMFK